MLDILLAISSLWRARRMLFDPGFPQANKDKYASLLENMCYYDTLGCYDPHDYVYALLGISWDAAASELFPDTTKTSINSSTQFLLLI